MATIDKDGNVRGLVGATVARKYRDFNILQSKPRSYEQESLASQLSAIENGIASSTAKILRRFLHPINNDFDKSVHSRLTGVIRTALHRSTTADPGMRDLYDAELSLLKGFQINTFAPIGKALSVMPAAEMRENGNLCIKIPQIRDFKDLKNPGNHGRTFFRFLCMAINFREEKGRYLHCKDFVIQNGDVLPEQEYIIDCQLPAGCVVMLSFSIHWQFDNEIMGPVILNSKELSPAEILGIWRAPANNNIDFSNHAIGQQQYMWKDLGNYCGNEKLKKAQDLYKKLGPLDKKAKRKNNPEKGEVLFPFDM